MPLVNQIWVSLGQASGGTSRHRTASGEEGGDYLFNRFTTHFHRL